MTLKKEIKRSYSWGQIKLPPCHKKRKKTSFKSFIDIKMTFSYLLDIYFIVYNVFCTLNATVKSWGIETCFSESHLAEMTNMTWLTWQDWHDCHDMRCHEMTWLTCHVAASLRVVLVWLVLSFPSGGRSCHNKTTISIVNVRSDWSNFNSKKIALVRIFQDCIVLYGQVEYLKILVEHSTFQIYFYIREALKK